MQTKHIAIISGVIGALVATVIALLVIIINKDSTDTQVKNDTVSTDPQGVIVDKTAPVAPLAITAPTKTDTSVTLTWKDSTDNIGVTGYNILQNGTVIAQNISSTRYTVSGLAKNTEYTFTIQARDAAGNISAPSEATKIRTENTTPTVVPKDTFAPSISNVAISTTTTVTATIVWTTDEPSTSQIEYGRDPFFGNFTALASAKVTNHQVIMTGLVADTRYHFRVKSTDAAGNTATGLNLVFQTNPLPDNTAPSFNNIKSQSITHNSAQISWITNEASDSQIEYGVSTSYGTTTDVVSLKVNDHNLNLSNLQSNMTYHYRVKSRDAAGNLGVSANYSFTTLAAPDTTAPTISSVVSGNVTATGATITWTTNESSDSVVEYGESTSYGSTATDSTNVTSHNVSLTGLGSSKTYNYRVKSKDAAGNIATSQNYTFQTPAPADTTAPNISGGTAGNITDTSAEISWTTNEASDSQVEYGATTSYGSQTTLNNDKVTNHVVIVSGLTPGTTYHFRVKSRDAAGNLAQGSDVTFSTAAPVDTTAPTISGQNCTSTATAITCVWTTNEAASSHVQHGPTTSYGTTAGSNTLVTSHSVEITGLTAATTYHLKIVTKDAANNEATSSDIELATQSE